MLLHKKKSLTAFLLTMINLSAILSIRNWPITAEFGFASIFFVLLAALFILIPTALVAAELATAWPSDGGVYVWIKKALGERIGFLAVFLLWIMNVTWYPIVLSFVASTIAFIFNPDLAQNRLFTFCCVLFFFWGATFVNLKGMKLSGWISSIGVISGTLIPGLIIIGMGFVWYFSGTNIQIQIDWNHLIPKFNHLSDFTFLVGVMFAFTGMEMPSVHAGNVINPQRNYPLAILYSSLIIITLSIFGSLAIAIIIPQNEIQLASGGIAAIYKVFNYYGLGNFVPVLALLIIIGALTSVSTWVAGPCRGVLAAAKDGELPAFFRKHNHHGMPINLMLTQGIIVTLISSIIIISPSVNNAFWMFVALSAQVYLIMYMLLFISAVVLRYKYPNHLRAYRIPFKNMGMWVVATIGLIGSVFGFCIGFVPPSQIEFKNLIFYEGFLIVGILLFCLTPVVVSRIQKKSI
jgi:putative glutamate/gamma-aminobutyrate antiporter